METDNSRACLDSSESLKDFIVLIYIRMRKTTNHILFHVVHLWMKVKALFTAGATNFQINCLLPSRSQNMRTYMTK
jgi:hypothetical protein